MESHHSHHLNQNNVQTQRGSNLKYIFLSLILWNFSLILSANDSGNTIATLDPNQLKTLTFRGTKYRVASPESIPEFRGLRDPLADELNGAIPLLNAMNQLPDLPEHLENLLWDLEEEGDSWDQSRESLKLWLSENNSILEAIDRASSDFDNVQWPVLYDDESEELAMAFNILLPHLGPLNDIARIRNVRYRLALEENDPDTFQKMFDLNLKTGNLVADGGGTLIDSLVGISIQSQTLTTLKKNLHGLSPHELDILAKSLTDRKTRPNLMKRAMISEKGFGLNCLRELLQPHGSELREGLIPSPPFLSALPQRLFTIIVPDKSIEDNLIDYYDRLISIMALPYPKFIVAAKDLTESIPEWNLLLKILAPQLERVYESEIRMQAEFTMAKSSIALKQFEHAMGRRAGNLSELVPNYLSEVPKDPFSGRAMVYINDTERYGLMSVGSDLEPGLPDEGDGEGDPAFLIEKPRPSPTPEIEESENKGGRRRRR